MKLGGHFTATYNFVWRSILSKLRDIFIGLYLFSGDQNNKEARYQEVKKCIIPKWSIIQAMV